LNHREHPTGRDGLVLDETYWNSLYGDGYDIDGHFNAKEHAKYAKSLMDLMDVKVQSLGDFGFGKGLLLREFNRAFKPARVVALEPSIDRVEELRKQKWISSTHIQIHNQTLEEFDPPYLSYAPLDLGICNSVIQYIPDRELKKVIEKFAKFTKFLYFNVPTKNDYIRMKKEIGFEDPYAHQRDLKFYKKLLSPYFHFVSFNLLESKTSKSPLVFEAEIFLH
jgi:trans-aconitate methyltransferase